MGSVCVGHDMVLRFTAYLLHLGCLSAGLSVSQQCLSVLLSGAWFTCTSALSQEALFKAQMWRRSPNIK